MTHEPQQIRAKSASDVSDAVRSAMREGHTLRFGRSSSAVPMPDGLREISLQDMSSVVDYPARDMTITVEAGLSVGKLNEVLQQENQQLPIDCLDSSMSIGAAVASDVSGPRQFGYGTFRDYLIGIEAVDGQGRIFHAGGRVVKNVAGYDLCRLMVGSRGALGILTQLTFKLKPLPETSMLTSFLLDSEDALETTLTNVNTSAAMPVVLDFDCNAGELNPQEVNGKISCSLTIGVEGAPQSCNWQMAELAKECAEGAVEKQPSQTTVEEFCKEFPQTHGRDIVMQTRPSNVAAIAAKLAWKGFASQGRAGNGIVIVSGGDQPHEVRTVCESIASNYEATVTQWDVDHPAIDPSPLASRVKGAFDPHSVFTT